MPENIDCPYCGMGENIQINKKEDNEYRCLYCGETFKKEEYQSSKIIINETV